MENVDISEWPLRFSEQSLMDIIRVPIDYIFHLYAIAASIIHNSNIFGSFGRFTGTGVFGIYRNINFRYFRPKISAYSLAVFGYKRMVFFKCIRYLIQREEGFLFDPISFDIIKVSFLIC